MKKLIKVLVVSIFIAVFFVNFSFVKETEAGRRGLYKLFVKVNCPEPNDPNFIGYCLNSQYTNIWDKACENSNNNIGNFCWKGAE